MSNWKNLTLQDACAAIVDCEHKTAPLVEFSEYHSVRTTNIKNGRIDFNTTNRVSPDIYKEWTNRLLPIANDIIIAREAPVGEVGQIPVGKRVCLGQRTVLLRPNPAIVDHKYLLYYLTNPIIKNDLISRSTGSVVEHLNVKDIKNFELRICNSIREQRAIASVLSSLDEKIDLLHRQNKTLETLAETLFRQWFVEEAKEDWKEGILGDIADNIRESITHHKISSGTKYVGLEHIDRKCIALNHFGFSDIVQSNKSQFQEDDILFGKLRPYFHKVCFAPFGGVCSTDILVLRPKMSYYLSFVLFAFFQKDVVEYANMGSEGTRMPRTNWAILRNYPLLLPPVQLLKKFNNIVEPFILKIKSNLVQIRTLESLRDALLPKLMSGEVRVQYNEQEETEQKNKAVHKQQELPFGEAIAAT